ncbi:probable enoyl-CoA hydratase 2, mitochondrial [Cajanus cajan]|uniref:probable enoyl-CoA hydratase 2, mitochondrial n=1 Tax=Cajanus cajan TaxID=3821 RepID=UPI00098D8E59|nr:probable enoyl-CoA hydratase 2, mitochondrial [Cajanus cajan]
MCPLRVLRTSSKPYLLNFITHQYQYHARRNLILQSSASELVKLRKLTGPYSGIVEISLDRPEAKNAIGTEMIRGLRHAFELINQNSYANVAMICSSVPKVFCAGADLKERVDMSESETKIFVNSLRSTFSFLEAVRIPTIAIIEGVALGGGLEMALACDIRICGDRAIMGFPETTLAIIPGAGGTQRLPRLVGKAVAKDFIFTGRRIEGEEALSVGLVNYCVPDGEAYSKALTIARDINLKGPVAVRMAKRAINEGVETDLTSALALEEDCYDQVLSTKDRREGLAAFAEKRKPIYIGE